jgi:hypothetical protein
MENGMVVFDNPAMEPVEYRNLLDWLDKLRRYDKKDAEGRHTSCQDRLSGDAEFCAMCNLPRELITTPLDDTCPFSLLAFATSAFTELGPLPAILSIRMFYDKVVRPSVLFEYPNLRTGKAISKKPVWARTEIARHFMEHAPTDEFLACLSRHIRLQALMHEANMLIPVDEHLPVNKAALVSIDRILNLKRR